MHNVGDKVKVRHFDEIIEGHVIEIGEKNTAIMLDDNSVVEVGNKSGFSVLESHKSNYVVPVDVHDYQFDNMTESDLAIKEGNVVVKRKYTEKYPSKKVKAKASVRNEVLSFMSSKGTCTKSELTEFFKTLGESRGKQVSRSWLTKNKNLFRVQEMGGTKIYTLSSYGKRVYKKLNLSEKENLKESLEHQATLQITTNERNDVTYIFHMFESAISGCSIYVDYSQNKLQLFVEGEDMESREAIAKVIKENKFELITRINESVVFDGVDLNLLEI